MQLSSEKPVGMVDIHCHLLPGIDDGAATPEVAWQMAHMAVQDGITTVIVTPHQLGSYANNLGDAVRQRTRDLQLQLHERNIPLRLLPGADVRIEPQLVAKIDNGQVVSLGDHRRHLLLELPHDLYIPLAPLLASLRAARMEGILSHPERNQGLLARRDLVTQLVDEGCLMQVTAGSLVGSMGSAPRDMGLWMLEQGLVHFIATDAHGVTSRRPLLSPAYRLVAERIGAEAAQTLFVDNPAAIAAGRSVAAGRTPTQVPRRSSGRWWFGKRAG